MIELNLLQKKQPLKLPTVLGVDLSTIDLKMLVVALVVYYVPGMILESYITSQHAEVETVINEIDVKNNKITKEIGADANIKSQLEAYKVQEAKLKSRSAQVDEILKNRTNPKKVLEKIARSIPEDLWFDQMLIDDKNEISISGGSYSPRAIGEFITSVNDSPYFGGTITPTKQENKQETLDGVLSNVEFFELKGKIINYDMRTN